MDAEGPDVPMLEARLRACAGHGEGRRCFRLGARRCAEELRACAQQAKCRQGATASAESQDRTGEAQVGQDHANLQQLEEQLSYTTIASPIDGIILSRDVEVGDAVSSILVLGSRQP